MKKILLLFIILLSFISCSKQGTIENEIGSLENLVIQDEVTTLSGEIIENQTGEISETVSPEIELQNELLEITHNNFKHILDGLIEMDKESLITVDCKTYFYLPQLYKRPDYQVEIYNDYIKKCEDLKPEDLELENLEIKDLEIENL